MSRMAIRDKGVPPCHCSFNIIIIRRSAGIVNPTKV